MDQLTLVSARVPAGLVNEFRARAVEDDRTLSSALRLAMRRYLANEAPGATNTESLKTATHRRHDAG